MSCFNPSMIMCEVDSLTGKLGYHFLGNGRGSDPKDYGNFDSLADRGYFFVAVPCRHCVGCHMDYARTWANRMCIELQDSKKAIFLTLTYRTENLPKTKDGVPTLCKRDWQLFMKRFRKAFSHLKLRFFMCGEYGSRRGRPHMHAIIFGIGLDDFEDLRIIGKNEISNIYYDSPNLAKIWGNGYILLGDVSYDSCSYVARYVTKKHYKKSVPELKGAIPEFTLSSRRPGIGFLNCEKYIQDFADRGVDHITVTTSDGVHTFPIPSSFIKKCQKDEKYLDICNYLRYVRFNRSNERLASEISFSGLDFDSYLRNKYRRYQDSVKLLPERKSCCEETKSKPKK